MCCEPKVLKLASMVAGAESPSWALAGFRGPPECEQLKRGIIKTSAIGRASGEKMGDWFFEDKFIFSSFIKFQG